ncbi:MAG: ribosome silencing factor [Magnetococcus sp. YQC-5]
MTKNLDTITALVNDLIHRLDEKKAKDVVVINLAGRCGFADYFVIATGTSTTHVSSLANEVIPVAHAHKIHVRGVEGLLECSWVLIDLGDVLVHIFRQETREFYHLEKLWSPQTRGVQEEKMARPTE